MNISNPNVSILVSSCDKYQEAWMPFFSLLKKYWEECNYPKYLLTESYVYSDYGVKTINSANQEWSSRLLDALNKIETEYVLFFLEDFFIMGKVKVDMINRYLSYMESDDNISVIYLKSSTGQNKVSSLYPELIKMEKGKKYYINFQAALWRRKDFIRVIAPQLSPWDIEENPRWEVSGDFYCVRNSSYVDCKIDVIPYLWALETGYGICKSRWLWNNKKLFKREGVQCECTTLPIMHKYNYIWNKIVKRLKKYMQ